MQAEASKVAKGELPEGFWISDHALTITLGRSLKSQSQLLASPEAVTIVEVERGGGATMHNHAQPLSARGVPAAQARFARTFPRELPARARITDRRSVSDGRPQSPGARRPNRRAGSPLEDRVARRVIDRWRDQTRPGAERPH